MLVMLKPNVKGFQLFPNGCIITITPDSISSALNRLEALLLFNRVKKGEN